MITLKMRDTSKLSHCCKFSHTRLTQYRFTECIIYSRTTDSRIPEIKTERECNMRLHMTRREAMDRGDCFFLCVSLYTPGHTHLTFRGNLWLFGAWGALADCDAIDGYKKILATATKTRLNRLENFLELTAEIARQKGLCRLARAGVWRVTDVTDA